MLLSRASKATPLRRRAGVAFVALLASGLVPLAADDTPWRVPNASVRFKLELAQKPTHESAGYFAFLPDGGSLPAPNPLPTVVAEKGGEFSAVDSYQLWHNKASGLSFVFADPGKGGEVYVYLANGPVRLWNPETGLTPSAILCADPTAANMGAAKALGKLGTAGPTVHARNKAGVKQAPYSIGGDETGRPRPASFYMLSHVVTKDPGKTWIAPFVVNGDCEVYVNGERLVAEKRIDKWGGTGAYFDLDKRMHRVEVFQTAPGTGPFLSKGKNAGLMYLTWRTPNASMEELGGVRSKKVPMAGTSRMETRILNDSEIVRSGRCRVLSASSKDGGPVAQVRVTPTHVYWFEGENPLLVYQLQALTGGHPEDTKYSWEFADGGKLEGASGSWLFPGFRENRVVLNATSGKGTSRSVHSFFGFGTAATSLSNPAHREAFRATCTTMLASYPASPDPLETWGRSHWNNLIRTLEPGKGYELLHELFTTRLRTVTDKLTPLQLATMQDVLLDMAQSRDPAAAMKLVDSMYAGARGGRRDQLMIRKAELHMYYLGDLEAAKRGLLKFATEGSGDIVDWARIRLGDVAFLSGDLNGATKHYADMQKKARERRNTAGALSSLVTEELLKPAPGEGGATDEPTPEGLPERGPGWKVGALRDVSMSENIATLIGDGFLLEAQQALRIWEREFPLSKLSGDFLLRESELYLELGDPKRAFPMLEAYCSEMDASSYLPDAARMLIKCAGAMKLPKSEVREVISKVQERMEFHPVAEELKEYLASED